MDFAILIVLTFLALLPTAFLVWEIRRISKEHSARENGWRLEKELLLNRIMTTNWSEFAQLSASMRTNLSGSSPDSEFEGRGLSDDAELARIGDLGDMTTDQIQQIFGEIDG